MDGAALVMLMITTLAGVTVVSSHQVCYNGLEYDLNSNNPHRWVLPYKDPCNYAAVLGGLTTQNASYQQGAPYYLANIAIRLLAFFGCQDDRKGIECSHPKPLGLEDGTIPDESISASSWYDSGKGRLNGKAWSPEHGDFNSWFEVDLGESAVVSGVITQGDTINAKWRVTEFEVKYKKLSSSGYDDVLDHTGAFWVFDGNTEDAATPVTNMFDQSIMATIVRIEPVDFVAYIAVRLELLGCRIN